VLVQGDDGLLAEQALGAGGLRLVEGQTGVLGDAVDLGRVLEGAVVHALLEVVVGGVAGVALGGFEHGSSLQL
jgi:hypothetical protein